MIKVICIGHDYEYEVSELLKLFYKAKDFTIESKEVEASGGILESPFVLVSELIMDGNKIQVSASMNGIKESFEEDLGSMNDLERKKRIKRNIKKVIFKVGSSVTGKTISWGILTGIRPTKIVHELLESGLNQEEILLALKNEYYIAEEKSQLLLQVAKTEHKFVYPIDENKVSIYISIPFCPTRCIYCSFPSNPMNQSAHLVDAYVEALCQEIEGVGALIKEAHKKVQTIYIGGGTPTTLNVAQFRRVFETINQHVDRSLLEEFTVEAGRPDTIDLEKLKFLKNSGVDRISINPQSMNECTLKEIGRNHTVADLIQSYHMAQSVGFKNINMDIIIGLPGEDVAMVEHTMKEIWKLQPWNLTVHTLAIKKSSRLKEKEDDFNPVEQVDINAMLNITQKYAEDMGLIPYYMYRQKHMVGNLENIGYSKPGEECIYNIQIMEEKQTIIALGAGAASKFTFPKENRLERVPNLKNVEQYIERVHEMLERKRKYMIDNN